MTPEKVSIRLWRTDQNPVSAEAGAVFARMLDPLTAEEQTAMAKFIDSQVAIENWNRIDEFGFLGMLSGVNSRIGWKQVTYSPGSAGDAGLVHVPKTGITSAGIGSLDLNFNLATNGFSQEIGDKNLGAYLFDSPTQAGLLNTIIGRTGAYIIGRTPAGAGQFDYKGTLAGAEPEVAFGTAPAAPLAVSVNQADDVAEIRINGVVDSALVGADSGFSFAPYDIFRGEGGLDFWTGGIASWWSTKHSGFDYVGFHTALDTLIADFLALP